MTVKYIIPEQIIHTFRAFYHEKSNPFSDKKGLSLHCSISGIADMTTDVGKDGNLSV